MDLFYRTSSIYHLYAVLLAPRQIQEPSPYALVELRALPIQPVQLGTPGDPSQPHGDGAVEQKGKVGSAPAGDPSIPAAHQLQIEPSTETLVRQGRIGETVAEHDLPLRKRWIYNLEQMTSAVGQIDHQLGYGWKRLARIKNDLAKRSARRRTPRFTGHEDRKAALHKRFRQKLDLSALPAALDTLEGDQVSARRLPQKDRNDTVPMNSRSLLTRAVALVQRLLEAQSLGPASAPFRPSAGWAAEATGALSDNGGTRAYGKAINHAPDWERFPRLPLPPRPGPVSRRTLAGAR